jgi:AcrR family transcriptional regulator
MFFVPQWPAVERRGTKRGRSPAGRPSRPQRTQEQRSAESRKRLLDAAVACLCERGFAGTTVAEIARRARLSLGCLQHHFPEKSDLLAASVEHVFEMHRERLVDRLGSLPDEPERAIRGLELLWESMQSDAFLAYLELVVASRTDPSLRRHVERTWRRLAEAFRLTFQAFYTPPRAALPVADALPWLVIGVLEGAMLSKTASPRDNNAERIVAAIKNIHVLATGNEPGRAKPKRAGATRSPRRARSR